MIKQNDPRRWQERADANMVREDHTAMANLSPNAFQREIPYHDIAQDPSRGTVQELTIAFFDGVKGKR